MKPTQKKIVALSSLLLAFFLIALICFAYNRYYNPEYYLNFFRNIFLAQLIVFALATCSVIVYSIIPLFRMPTEAKPDITKIVVLSETNTPEDEFSLEDKTSALIVKGDYIYISVENDFSAAEYALLNRVENHWYIERMSDRQSVGIKRAGEQYVYKLKPGLCYKLRRDDVIYIDNGRLLVM